ncbi:DUF397 domain-containing protein [Actinomadura adrarensis]|uniref:DUF397 domain-containing protein n=1 Tax=Actinomadura adrarensis TaxID=1819600 RepID=A0ABW3CC13_9ACTN
MSRYSSPRCSTLHDLGSHSGGVSGQCVEVADLGGAVGLRDSKKAQAGHLRFGGHEFALLVGRIKACGLGF